MLKLNDTTWKLIKELSHGDKTPTQLSKKLGLTLPGVHVQLKELETKKLVKRIGVRKGRTRPYSEYSIGDGFVYFIKALPNDAEQNFIEVDENIRIHLNIWAIPQKEYHYAVEWFWWELQKQLDDIEAVLVYGSVARGDARQGSDIDILLLVKKDVKKFEEKYNAKMVGLRGNRKMVMCQVFIAQDFENSLKKGSDFAKEAMSNKIIIYDPRNKLGELKR